MPTFRIYNIHNDGPIGGYKLSSSLGERYLPFSQCCSVFNPKGRGSFTMFSYKMQLLPDYQKVDSELGVIPLEMKFYIDFQDEILYPVVDYGIDKTENGDLAWIVFDDSKKERSLYVYANIMRMRHKKLYAKELLNSLIALVPKLERIEEYFHGGGIKDLGVSALKVQEANGIITHVGITYIPLGSYPNQGVFDSFDGKDKKENWCLAPEVKTSHHDKRADVFSLARSLGYWEHVTFWNDTTALKKLPFEEALHRSCELQIEAGLYGVRREVLEKALAFNPDDRYQTLSEFLKNMV